MPMLIPLSALSILAVSACYVIRGTQLSSLSGYYALHVGIAAMGAAAAPVAYTRIVAAHFRQSRGFALGITLLGPSLAATLAPAAISQVIAQAGWSTGYLVLATLTAAMLPFLLLLKSCDRPQQPNSTAQLVTKTMT